MATSEYVMDVTIQSVSGLAECPSCKEILSFLIDGMKLENAHVPACRSCQIDCEIDHDSIHVEVSVKTRRAS